MKNSSIALLLSAVVLSAVACVRTTIRGSVQGAEESPVAVGLLNGADVVMLDTVRTDADGRFTCNVKVEKGQPEFIYLYHEGKKVASLLLSRGEKVDVVVDSAGAWTVEGSEESANLRQVEAEFADFLSQMAAAAASDEPDALAKCYVSYYRSRLKYISEHPRSLTVIPVLYQAVNENFPVFYQKTDAFRFRSAYDSLVRVYPDSKYVKALEKEMTARMNVIELENKLRDAKVSAYPDLELPSIDGSMKTLSETPGKVVMLYFWLASDPEQKMFNQEVMLPVYRDFHDKGFEVYAVAMDTDKGVWASAVRDQKLPWINVCDGLSSDSPAAALYNVYRSLPVSFLLVDGEMEDLSVHGEADLRAFLKKHLK